MGPASSLPFTHRNSAHTSQDARIFPTRAPEKWTTITRPFHSVHTQNILRHAAPPSNPCRVPQRFASPPAPHASHAATLFLNYHKQHQLCGPSERAWRCGYPPRTPHGSSQTRSSGGLFESQIQGVPTKPELGASGGDPTYQLDALNAACVNGFDPEQLFYRSW
jgi:hypothetical protein